MQEDIVSDAINYAYREIFKNNLKEGIGVNLPHLLSINKKFYEQFLEAGKKYITERVQNSFDANEYINELRESTKILESMILKSSLDDYFINFKLSN